MDVVDEMDIMDIMDMTLVCILLSVSVSGTSPGMGSGEFFLISEAQVV